MLVIFCPACSAGLQLPRSVLAKRARRICCALCEHRWIEAPVIDSEAALDSSPTQPGPEMALHAENIRSESDSGEGPEAGAQDLAQKPGPLVVKSPRPRPSPRAVRHRYGRAQALPRTWPGMDLGIGALALLILGVAKRESIVRLAPPLAGAYAMIGLPVNVQGLEWREVRTRVVTEASQRVLAVEGEIRNLRGRSQTLPDIQLSLRDNGGREIYAWKAPAPQADLGGGQTVAFRARLASPPGAATAVRVVFADAVLDSMTP